MPPTWAFVPLLLLFFVHFIDVGFARRYKASTKYNPPAEETTTETTELTTPTECPAPVCPCECPTEETSETPPSTGGGGGTDDDIGPSARSKFKILLARRRGDDHARLRLCSGPAGASRPTGPSGAKGAARKMRRQCEQTQKGSSSSAEGVHGKRGKTWQMNAICGWRIKLIVPKDTNYLIPNHLFKPFNPKTNLEPDVPVKRAKEGEAVAKKHFARGHVKGRCPPGPPGEPGTPGPPGPPGDPAPCPEHMKSEAQSVDGKQLANRNKRGETVLNAAKEGTEVKRQIVRHGIGPPGPAGPPGEAGENGEPGPCECYEGQKSQ